MHRHRVETLITHSGQIHRLRRGRLSVCLSVCVWRCGTALPWKKEVLSPQALPHADASLPPPGRTDRPLSPFSAPLTPPAMRHRHGLAFSCSGRTSGPLFICPRECYSRGQSIGPIASSPALRPGRCARASGAAPRGGSVMANSAGVSNWQFPGPTWGCSARVSGSGAYAGEPRSEPQTLAHVPRGASAADNAEEDQGLGGRGGLIGARCGTLQAGARSLPVAQDRRGKDGSTLPVNLHGSGNAV